MSKGGAKWFEVDRDGLSELMARRGPAFVVNELVSNSLDAPGVSRVTVQIDRIGNTDSVHLMVEDDSPVGFTNLEHAWTLFKRSDKRAQPDTRGRFNLGEKVAFAVMESAEIKTTTGRVVFSSSGREVHSERRDRGTVVSGELLMDDDGMEACKQAVLRMIAPESVTLSVNGQIVPSRIPVKTIHAVLPTEIEGADGRMRRTQRKTRIDIYDTLAGEEAHVFELGVPVVASGDRWHVSVAQKTPVGFDRDTLPPAFMSQLRAIVVEAMAEALTAEDANSAWAREAATKHASKLSDQTVQKLMDLRFGQQRVSFDPTDLEANNAAAAAGYTVVHGRQLSGEEWEAARRAGAIAPAGKLFSTVLDSLAGAREMHRNQWTAGMADVAELTRRLAPHLIGVHVDVKFVNDAAWGALACYGARTVTYNVGRLGYAWFEGDLASVIDLMVHELGHEMCGNHLDKKYNDALTMIAGKAVALALSQPAVFDRQATLVKEAA